MQNIVGFTLFFLLMIHSAVESSDSLFDSSDLLLASDGDLPVDTTSLFTDDDGGESFNSFDGTLASTQGDCTSNNDNDNLFASSGAARLRPRADGCLLPLPPIPNIYDSNTILNQFTPETLPKPDITIPGTDTPNEKDIFRLNEMFNLPEFDPDTNSAAQDDVCPEELVGDSRIPVCESPSRSRDQLRRKGEDHYTLYNVRHCRPPQECCRPVCSRPIQLIEEMLISQRLSDRALQEENGSLVLLRGQNDGKSHHIFSVFIVFFSFTLTKLVQHHPLDPVSHLIHTYAKSLNKFY